MGGIESSHGGQPVPSYVRATVSLNVYDVDTSTEIYFLNGMLRPLGTGIFHCGVQILSDEWSFRGGKHGGTGVFRCPPGFCGNLRPRETLNLGTVVLPTGQVEAILEHLKEQWPCRQYDIFRRNCSHFCDEFCMQLGVGPLPAWVTNMAGAAAQLADVSQQVRSATAHLAGQISGLFEVPEADSYPVSDRYPAAQAQVPLVVERVPSRSLRQPLQQPLRQPRVVSRGGAGLEGMRQAAPPPPLLPRREKPIRPTLLTSRVEPVITREAVVSRGPECWPRLQVQGPLEDEDSVNIGCSF